jgi:hypothetical protein
MLKKQRKEQGMDLPLLAGPKCPFGMVFVLAACVGVHQKGKLSGELIAILLRHVWNYKLIVVHWNENAPFT